MGLSVTVVTVSTVSTISIQAEMYIGFDYATVSALESL
jgi:hypothetical protein